MINWITAMLLTLIVFSLAVVTISWLYLWDHIGKKTGRRWPYFVGITPIALGVFAIITIQFHQALLI